MADQLPLEVCRRIIEHLQPMYDNPTLIALTRTSRALQPVSERLLYLYLYLVGARTLPTLLRTLRARPALALIPRHMYIHPTERRADRAPHAYWGQLEELLQLAGARVEVLAILGNDADAAFASWVLRGLRNASGSLTLLRVSFWWDSEVAEFLESAGAQGLTRLETADAIPLAVGAGGVGGGQQQQPAAVEVSRGAAPNLRMVEAPPPALCLLVPGRPVTHVKLRQGPATTLLTLPPALHLIGECLVRSVAPQGVIALDLGDLTYGNRAEAYSLEVMELAPRFLPHLQFLGRINFPWTKDVPASRMHKALIRLPDLHTLELVITHMHPAPDAYWELATACELRTFSPSLRSLMFWRAYDARRWVWLEQEADWVLAANQETYTPWGGL